MPPVDMLGVSVGVTATRRWVATARAGVRRRGAFIVLEGIDRCGKTTQASKLVDVLEGDVGRGRVEHWRFPDRSTRPIGETVDAYLKSSWGGGGGGGGGGGADASRVGHLLFSANRWEKRRELLAALEAGTTLVVDRYAYSGVAYGAAQGLDPTWCRASDAGLPAPDLVLFLDLAVDESMRRGGFGGERYETEDMQRRVCDAFRTMMRDDASGRWVRVDAAQSQDAVHEEIKGHARAALARCAHLPIDQLWTP